MELVYTKEEFAKYSTLINKERNDAIFLANSTQNELTVLRNGISEYYASISKERDMALDQIRTVQKELSGVRENFARYSTAVRDVPASIERIVRKLAQEMRSRGIPVEIDDRSSKLSLPADFLFATGSADLGESSAVKVDRVAHSLRATIDCNVVACGENDPTLQTILIEGHADQQPVPPTSRFSDNWHLSTARAQSFLGALWQRDPELAGAVNSSGQALFGIAGFGDSRPAGGNRISNPANYERDRRIELRLIFAPPVISPEPYPVKTSQPVAPSVPPQR